MNFTNISIPQGRKSKILSALFIGTLTLCALASTASLAWATTVSEPIVINNSTQAASGDGWEWTPTGSSGTLTLENADIQVADTKDAKAAIVVPDGATIHLKGENNIAITANSPASNDIYAAIYCEGDLIIAGDSGATAAIEGQGQMDWGIYCVGDLTAKGSIALDIAAVTTASSGEDVTGATGTYIGGNLIVNDQASVTTIGSDNGLTVAGSTNITDANSIKLGTKNSTSKSLAANFSGDVMISETENVSVNESAIEAWGAISISNSNVNLTIEKSDHALFAQQGLEITNGSQVRASSKGHAIYVLDELSVKDSNLHVEGVGAWSTAIRIEGNFIVDNADVTALGNSGVGGKGISILNSSTSELAGTITLMGSPSIVAEGGDAAIQFVSLAEDFDGEHVILEPSIGAIEGGMLSYAERTFTSPDEFTMSIWSYATQPISISDDFGIEGASQRVTIGVENSLLYITDNGEEATGLEGITAIAADGTEYPAVEWLDGSHVGYYRFLKDLPAGTYSIDFGSDYETANAAQIEVPENGLSIFTMNFHTISVEQTDKAQTWLIEPSSGEHVTSLERILEGAQVSIGTQTDNSCRFIKYEAIGTTPEWENGNAALAEQMITVRGDATIKAVVSTNPPENPNSGVSDSKTPSLKKSDASTLPSTGDSSGIMPIILIALAAITTAITLIARTRKQ